MSDRFEIAFSFDTTGSMYSCLEEVRRRLGEMVRDLKKAIPTIRIAIFAHGDYCDKGSTYVTKYINFTDSADQLCNFVQNVSRTGGGDTPECYELVMREVQEDLSWSPNSQKALVLIGDAPPHEKSEAQNYRHLDWKEEAERLRDRDIKIYAIECNGIGSHNFYQHIAAQTFGYFMPLDNFNKIKEVLMSICYREAGLGDYSTSGSSMPVSMPATVSAPKHRPPSPALALMEDSGDDADADSCGMKCYKCKVAKLPNEFPSETVSEKCRHHPGICLRCVVKYVKEHAACPQEDCTVKVDPGCKQIQIFEATLDRMFLDYSKVIEENKKMALTGNDIVVSTMNGDTAWIPYRSNMTIVELKKEVEKELSIKESQQKLLYKERVLKANKSPGNPFRLSDYGIEKNASLSLIVPLYCIPENLDHVVFDLSWEFPNRSHVDFLDASCLTFNKTQFVQLIDWNHPNNDYYLKGSVFHSAKNETLAGGRIGHQTIHVYLKRVPSTVTHLYFTLSSWRAPNLSAFSNPSLQFYDASDSSTNLCGTTFGHALNSQAVVICSVVRTGSQWQIFECDAGGCVNGNSKKYNPIRQRITELIASDD